MKSNVKSLSIFAVVSFIHLTSMAPWLPAQFLSLLIILQSHSSASLIFLSLTIPSAGAMRPVWTLYFSSFLGFIFRRLSTYPNGTEAVSHSVSQFASLKVHFSDDYLSSFGLRPLQYSLKTKASNGLCIR